MAEITVGFRMLGRTQPDPKEISSAKKALV